MVCYIIDEMAQENVLRPQPVGFRDHLRVQHSILEFFKLKLNRDKDKVREEIEKENRLHTQGNMLRLRRIYQTPTVTIVAPLQREETHRVVRKYKKYKDFFFRLNMVSENLDKLHFGSNRMQEVLNYMITILAEGLTIGGDRSQIVNYSNSQLKSHSIWMLLTSQIPEIQLERIISELGEFDISEGPLKMYSRRGQCFTTTKFITVLTGEQIRIIEDLKVKKTDDPEDTEGFYVFSDGCGNVSLPLSRLMSERLGLYQCTAFQVRVGGAKGVLLTKPSLSEETIVELRQSMIKFQS